MTWNLDGKRSSELIANDFRDCDPIGYAMHRGRMLVYFDVGIPGYVGHADFDGCRIGYMTDMDLKAIESSDKRIVASIKVIRREKQRGRQRFRKRPIKRLG